MGYYNEGGRYQPEQPENIQPELNSFFEAVGKIKVRSQPVERPVRSVPPPEKNKEELQALKECYEADKTAANIAKAKAKKSQQKYYNYFTALKKYEKYLKESI